MYYHIVNIQDTNKSPDRKTKLGKEETPNKNEKHHDPLQNPMVGLIESLTPQQWAQMSMVTGPHIPGAERTEWRNISDTVTVNIPSTTEQPCYPIITGCCIGACVVASALMLFGLYKRRTKEIPLKNIAKRTDDHQTGQHIAAVFHQEVQNSREQRQMSVQPSLETLTIESIDHDYILPNRMTNSQRLKLVRPALRRNLSVDACTPSSLLLQEIKQVLREMGSASANSGSTPTLDGLAHTDVNCPCTCVDLDRPVSLPTENDDTDQINDHLYIELDIIVPLQVEYDCSEHDHDYVDVLHLHYDVK